MSLRPLIKSAFTAWPHCLATYAALAMAVAIALLALSGCALPQWRVFQKTIPADQSAPPPAQVEGQKRAAAYIAAVTTPPVANPAQTVGDVHEVAADLSASLGQPKEPVKAEDRDKVIRGLQDGLKAKDAQLDAWRAFGRKYAGTPLEGTGINLAGPAGLLGLVGVVAACIACPALGYAVLRVLPVLWGYFRRTTQAIGEFAAERPEAGAALASKLGDRMDKVHKRLVKVRAADFQIPKPSTATS